MNFACLLLALLPTVSPAADAPSGPPVSRRTVLVLDLKANGVDPALVNTLTEVVATAVAKDPQLSVASGADLRALVSVEEQKQSIGCEDTSCFADLAGALGANLIVSGSVGQLGSMQIVSLNLYDANQKVSIAREKVQADAKDAAELSSSIDAAIDRMFNRTAAIAVEPASGSSALGTIGVVVAVVGGAAVSVGAGVAGWSYYVQDNPASEGADKKFVAPLFVPALLVAGAGVAVVGVGIGLMVVGWSE